jgi:hypothetical protein
MDGTKNWLGRWLVGQVGAALAAAGFAGLALLLAFLRHLGVAAVAAAILAGFPAAYLTWAQLSAGTKKAAWGRPVRRWAPESLGVHQVIGGGPMPPYIRQDE